MVRFSTNFSNRDIFTENKHEYGAALKNNGYLTKLVYTSSEEDVDYVLGKFYGLRHHRIWLLLIK